MSNRFYAWVDRYFDTDSEMTFLKLREWLKKWVLEKGWIILIPIILTIIAIWQWPQMDIPPVNILDNNGNIQENTQTLYFLSAMAQVLGAVFALVFIISLIVFQLFSRSSQRLPYSLFDSFTISYTVVFIISIILALWLITDPEAVAIKISFTLTTICLFLLVPHFLNLKESLSLKHVMSKLEKKAIKHLNKTGHFLYENLDVIENLTLSAYNYKDYTTLSEGLDVLANIAYEIDKCCCVRTEDNDIEATNGVAHMIYNRLKSLIDTSKEDFRTQELVLSSISHLCSKTNSDKWPQYMKVIIRRMGEIGVEAAKKGQDKLAGYSIDRIVRPFYWIGEDNWRTWVDTAIANINNILVYAISENLEFTVNNAVTDTSNVCKVAIERDEDEIVEKIVSYVGSTGLNLIPNPALVGEVYEAVKTLLIIGTRATSTNKEAIKTIVKDNIKNIEVKTNSQEFEKTINSVKILINSNEPELIDACNEFIEYYKNNGN